MCRALLRRARGATTVGCDFRAAVTKVLKRFAHQATRYLFADPDHVDLPTGEHVPLRRDGRTEHGFLPEDAWKERCFGRACRAELERLRRG
jgi:hypothetical protein